MNDNPTLLEFCNIPKQHFLYIRCLRLASNMFLQKKRKRQWKGKKIAEERKWKGRANLKYFKK